MNVPSCSLNRSLFCAGIRFEARNGFTLVEILGATIIILVLAALLFPAFTSALKRNEQSICLSRMRQVGNVILLYGAENDGDLLPVLSHHNGSSGPGVCWYQTLDKEGYLQQNTWTNKPNGVMSCPSRDVPPSYAPDTLHYAMNVRPGPPELFPLGNTKPSNGPAHKFLKIPRPSQSFMLAEVNKWYVAYLSIQTDGTSITPHSGGLNLFFYDGHAQYWSGMLPLRQSTNSYPWD